MRPILGVMLAGAVFTLLASAAMVTQATTKSQGLTCDKESNMCRLHQARLDEIINKAYQLGYERGRDEGFDAARSLLVPVFPTTRWVIPDKGEDLGARIILTEPGQIPEIENAYPLPPGLWK